MDLFLVVIQVKDGCVFCFRRGVTACVLCLYLSTFSRILTTPQLYTERLLQLNNMYDTLSMLTTPLVWFSLPRAVVCSKKWDQARPPLDQGEEKVKGGKTAPQDTAICIIIHVKKVQAKVLRGVDTPSVLWSARGGRVPHGFFASGSPTNSKTNSIKSRDPRGFSAHRRDPSHRGIPRDHGIIPHTAGSHSYVHAYVRRPAPETRLF